MKYLPVSSDEKDGLVKYLGKQHIDDFFSHIPEEFKKQTSSLLPPPKSESEIRRFIQETIEKQNFVLYPHKNFMGGLGHAHEIPAIIDPIISRGEFLTSYTPYQPEVSQGTLQAMFEYQTMMADLMGVDVSNASLYDGSTAVIEALLMACRIKKKYKVLLSPHFPREYKETVATYSEYGVFTYEFLASSEKGTVDAQYLEEKLAKEKDGIAAVIVASPNAYGIIEDLETLSSVVRKYDVLFIVALWEAISMGLLQPPGKYADIVCGEAQSFGIPLQYGGPWLGFIGTKESYIRNLPGRLIGMGSDRNGKRAFAITLSTREQHIRREKATSNICTNQGLMALRAAIYLSLTGKRGLREIALRCAKLTAYARTLLSSQNRIRIVYPDSPVFNELYLETPVPASQVFEHAWKHYGIAAGTVIDENHLLVAFNETMKPGDVEHWKNILVEAC